MLSIKTQGRVVLRFGNDREGTAYPGLRIGPGKGVYEQQRTSARKAVVARQPSDQGSSFVMRPHSKHLYRSPLNVDLIYKPVLNVDSPRIGATKVANELFERRRILKGIPPNNLQ
jgi:hypothetical protein